MFTTHTLQNHSLIYHTDFACAIFDQAPPRPFRAPKAADPAAAAPLSREQIHPLLTPPPSLPRKRADFFYLDIPHTSLGLQDGPTRHWRGEGGPTFGYF